MITHDQAKGAATRIVERLRALGVDIKNSHGYQAVAAYHDIPDWNRLSSVIDRDARTPSNSAAKHTHRHSRAKAASYHALVDGPGTGKTTTLWMRTVIEAFERNGTLLFISLEGEDYIPTQLVGLTHRITVSMPASAEPSEQPTVSLVAASVEKPSGAVINVRLPRGVSLFDTAPAYFLHILKQLPEILAMALPAGFLESVSLICLDEAHRVMTHGSQELGRELFSDIIPRWRQGNADVIVAAQALPWLSFLDLKTGQAGHSRPHIITSSKRVAESYSPSLDSDKAGRCLPSVIGQFTSLLEHADPVELFTSDILLVELIASIVYHAIERKKFTNWAANTPRARLFQGVLDDAAEREAERRARRWP